MMNFTRRALIFAAPLTGILVATAEKDPKVKERSTPNAEKSFSGTVERMTEHECEICKGVEWSLILKSAAGQIEVRLGPKAFFQEHDFFLSRGDSISVKGIQYTERGKEIVLANEVRKGGEHLILRGDHGRPAWIEVQGHICPICGN
jgi:hypothetical protein